MPTMTKPQFDTEQLESLLNARQWQKAKALLNSFLQAEITQEEKGAIYVAFVTTYLSVMNRISAEYEAALDDAITNVKVLNAKEKEVHTKIDLARVKNEIKQMSK
ncbi:MAG: hypothetical protein Q7R62_02355 [bacterium]|nr:hypothetical protein [bacterium]